MKKFLSAMLTVLALMSFVVFSTSEVDAASNRSTVIYPREGDCRIVPRVNTQYALDIDGGDRANNMSTITLEEKDDYDSQVFTLKRVNGDWYKIVHKSTGYVLNVRNGEDSNHTRLWLYKDDGTDSCYWRFLDAGNGFYIIQSKLGERRILDLSNGKARSGATVQLWEYHTKDAGQWGLDYESRRSNSGYGSHRGGHGRYGGYDDDSNNNNSGRYGSHHGREHSRW